jgi:hypothetical protein
MSYLVYSSFGPKQKLNGEFESFDEAQAYLYEMLNAFPRIADHLKEKYNLDDKDLIWQPVSDEKQLGAGVLEEWKAVQGTMRVFIAEHKANGVAN